MSYKKIIPRGVYDVPTQLEMDENLDLREEKAFREEE